MRGPANEAVYRLLLRGLPRRFRERHGEEMLEWFREHRVRTTTRAGIGTLLAFWLTILGDLIRTMAVEHTRTRTHRRQERTGEDVMTGMLQEVRLTVRGLFRRPAFAALVLGTLALGVGSATAVSSVVDDVLLAPLPYASPDRIVRVGKISSGRPGVLSVSALDLRDLQERNHSFEALAASRPASMTLSGDGAPELLRVAMVSSSFFGILGQGPVLGRTWDGENDQPDGAPVVVLGNGLWQRRWGGDPALIGRTATLDGTAYTVIGILPPGFVPPEALNQRGTDAWIPLAGLDPTARANRRDGFLQVIGKLRPDATQESATEELTALGARISNDHPGPGPRTFGLSPLQAETVGDIGTTLLPMLAAVSLLLAIACINIANLLVMRANERSGEFALRKCIGAGRARLTRQLMTEGVLLGLLGGLLGAPVAAAGVKTFAVLGPRELPRLSEVSVDGRVFFVALAISLATSLLFSLLPALAGARADLAGALARGGRGRSGSRSGARVRELLVVAQTALAIVLTISGGLLLNSLVRAGRVDLGFSPEGVGVVSVTYRRSETDEELVGFFDDVLTRVSAIPGVRAAGATSTLPLSGRDQLRINAPGLRLDADDQERGGLSVNYEVVTPGYFDAIGIAGRRGRTFTRADDAGAPRVAVVNERLAHVLAEDGDPTGFFVTLGDDPDGQRPIEIVGVVADTRQERIEVAGAEEIFFPLRQRPTARMEIAARGGGPGAALLPAMRARVWAVRPDLPIRRSLDMTSFVARSLSDRRFFALLLGAFAILALTLTVVGVYGTLAYAVAQRRRELGIRLAIGATGTSVMRAVLVRSIKMLSVGTAIGVAAALISTRLIASLLFGVTATDPWTVGVAAFAVLGAGLAATMVPATRAARVDPAVSLRIE